MLFKSLLLFLVGGLNVLFGLVVLLRDYRSLQNKLFFIFSLSLGGWVIGIGGFLLTNSAGAAFAWAKLYYECPLVIAASMPLFAHAFPTNESVTRRWIYPISIGYLSLALPLLFVHSFVTTTVIYHSWGKEILLNKPDYLLYSVFLLACFGSGLAYAFNKAQHARGIARSQMQFYAIGFTLTSFFGVLFNLIYPWFGNYRLIWLGPLFSSAFLFATGYSMVKHRMFDIRLVIARSAAYITSLTIVASFYGFVVFGIARLAFNFHISIGAQVFLSLATGVAGLAFPDMRRRFDSSTSQFFYRDSYDAQELFDKLNSIFVSTTNLHNLLSRSSALIAQDIKAESCVIVLPEAASQTKAVVDAQELKKLTSGIRRSVIVTDYIDDPKHAKLKKILVENRIAVLISLASNISKEEGGRGYIVLGTKKSGNPYSNEDLRVLDTIANEMFIAIQNALHFEEIQSFNRTLQQRIDEATRELRRTNDKLKALDETKDDFISMASHQLRTPLTSIKGYISIVMEGDAGKINATQREMLGQAFFSSQRMVYLIADLLNVSRLKTGKFLLETSAVNLAEVVQQEITQLVETASARSLTLVYEKPADFPSLTLDETKIRQVIMNFVDNAIYYTPASGHITVRLVNGPTSVELRVEDDGIGVPRAEQPHLFTKFYRAPNARKARPDGTGLGLFMAKKVVLALGGALIFESQEGKGSTFGFVFSKAKLGVAAAHPTPDKQ